MLELETWERNTFEVQAVRVTEENIRQVAEWTGGECARTLTDNPRNYVLMDTAQGSRIRQSKVFVGDWIVCANTQFKHYKNNTIEMLYHRKVEESDVEKALRELLEQALTVDIEVASVSYGDLVKRFTERAMDIVGREE